MTDPETPHHGKRAMLFVLVTVLLDTIGFGIVIPVLPELIMELTGEGLGRAAIYGGWLLFLYALMQLFFAPIMGNLSDRFGRRPILLLSLLAFGVDYLLMGLAPTIAWLFVGRLVAGITGATHSTANAYVADVSEPEERAANFGLIGAAWGLGFILGPVIGGLLGGYGPRVPFFAAAGLALVNVAYGALVLPESLPASGRRPFSIRRANPIGALTQMRRYPIVVGLLIAILFYQIAHDANPSAWSFYTMLKFGWTEREIGYSMGLVGLTIVLVQGGLIRVALARFGERWCVYAGFLLLSIGYLGFAFSTAGWMMLAFIIPFSLGGLAMPALRGILANQVPDNAQGELQGAIASLMSLTAIVAPVLMTQLFGFFTADPAGWYFPGAPFFLAGVLVLISAAWFARVVRTAAPAAPLESDSGEVIA